MAKSNSSKPSVTRVKASDSKKVKKTDSSVKAAPVKNLMAKPKRNNPLSGFFGYFKGAWYELKQVHWPNRKATWSLTAAVLVFAAFFVVFIALLDALFKYLFEIILK